MSNYVRDALTMNDLRTIKQLLMFTSYRHGGRPSIVFGATCLFLCLMALLRENSCRETFRIKVQSCTTSRCSRRNSCKHIDFRIFLENYAFLSEIEKLIMMLYAFGGNFRYIWFQA